MTKNKWVRRIFSCMKYLVFSFGFLFLFLIILAFTRIPFDVHRWLGTHESAYHFKPGYILFLGGSGMPSESNLIRLYYVTRLSEKYPDASIILAHPVDTIVISLMKEELLVHGIDSSRIFIEKYGTNTREQALKMDSMFAGIKEKNVLVVTSPENMYRSVRVFRKCGFLHVGGEPAFENAMSVDLSYNHRVIGGKTFMPDVSGNMKLRYTFWNYLKLEITCLREFTAIIYYKMNGWI
ncbi:MAG: YdcF family protein [Bacteroidetes bacterium]|nr:YdcF family protein [Bacteroidota bacterium]